MKQKPITLTTDFGDQFAVSQLHAVLASLGFAGKLIENHSVTPFSILEGAFEIGATAHYSPPGAIHVGVIDPDVGNNRRAVIIKTKHSFLVGPDNGILYPTASREGIVQAWRLKGTHISDHISNTFHGRDIFIKAEALLSRNRHPASFGSTTISTSTLKKLIFKDGQVVHIDHYGNIKIHWSDSIRSKYCTITTKAGVFTVPFVKTFSDVPPGKALTLLGSSGTLELALNLARADEFFNVKLGDILKVKYSQKNNYE